MRKITIFASKGGKNIIESSVRTWGDLKPLVEEQGYDLSNLQPTENVGKTTLLHADAVLPEGEFILFLRPIRTKSGIDGMAGKSFKELRATVKEYIDSDGEVFKNHINKDKNYTRLSTEALRDALSSYTPITGDTSQAEEVKEEEVTETTSTTDGMTLVEKLNKAKEYVKEACDSLDSEDVCDRTEMITEDIDGLIADVEENDTSDEDKAAAEAQAKEEAAEKEAKRLAKEKEEAELAALADEMDDINDGFIN